MGNDTNGQMGNGTTPNSTILTPVRVDLPSNIVSLGEGKDYGLAVDSHGKSGVGATTLVDNSAWGTRPTSPLQSRSPA